MRPHWNDLESCRPALTRYATRVLRNRADAGTVVQDTLMAAAESLHDSAGRRSTMSRLHHILKQKIIDTLRRQSRAPAPNEVSARDAQRGIDAWFTPDGHWREPPANWGSPDATLARRDFSQVLESCIACLPERAARVLTMREVLELEVSEICDVLAISPNDCFDLLHQARTALRVLLEQRWFALQPSA